MSKNTALLIFARTASEESKHKSFRASKAFFELQNKHILGLAKASGLDFFWIDEKLQKGENFEQRYLHAIQSIFDRDYKQVISIGNDSPELGLNHLHNAIESLTHNDMCFGPSADGGFYLWGIKREFFKKEKFINFAWKTKDLLSEILEELSHQNLNVSCLQKLVDLDKRDDAFLLLDSADLTSQLKAILIQMLGLKKDLYCLYLPILKSEFTCIHYNKGSPWAA